MLFDLTLLVCSFETPFMLQSMLKSFVHFHPDAHVPLVVMENSRDNETEQILKKNNIFYVRNPGATHSTSVSVGLQYIPTKYCLLIDSDILFRKPIHDLMSLFIEKRLSLMGELQESRGGYNLFSRISPHACFINMEHINKFGIKYHDQERIDSSQSNGFFGNVPIQKYNSGKYYDVGSTFLEDVLKHNLKIGKINSKLAEYVKHYEGGSWRTKSGIKEYVDWGKQVEEEFFKDAAAFEIVSIENRFLRIANEVVIGESK